MPAEKEVKLPGHLVADYESQLISQKMEDDSYQQIDESNSDTKSDNLEDRAYQRKSAALTLFSNAWRRNITELQK